MRRVKAKLRGIERRTIARVVSLAALAAQWRPGLTWLAKVASREDLDALHRLHAAEIGPMLPFVEHDELVDGWSGPVVIANMALIEPNDVVALMPGGELQVLYRESDLHHTVFLTNRCNSRCVMCSQPPTKHDDSWLVEEAKQVAAHIGRGSSVLGFTGGEPLLLGVVLRDLLLLYMAAMPDTRLEVLTNGRLLSDTSMAERVLRDLPKRVSWMVPLYGHADFLHDQIVRAEGAFDETIGGLLNLQGFGQAIQLRVVLIEPVLQVLPDLCAFIAKNLPFVREVALMGCEPVGFALANRSVCEVDIRQWEAPLSKAVRTLQRVGLPVMLMNIPLCAVPAELRPLAQRSISDWKQVYAPECSGCSARGDCSGLFAWHRRGWRPTILLPMVQEAVS